MAVIRLYRHGFTAGIPPTVNIHERVKRGQVEGWSESSTRSNTRFLYAVEEDRLDGHGYALSLTLRDCPASSDDFHRIRRAFTESLRRMELIRMHWLIEWQRRGCPHMHMAVWLPYRGADSEIINHWCRVAAKYGAKPWAQYVESITDSIGWFKYLSKHASRGISHYQRSPESVPSGWKNKTGRMWGSQGDWPLRESMDLTIDKAGYNRLRRIVKGWRIGDARRAMVQAGRDPRRYRQAAGRLRAARRMYRSSDQHLSAVLGLSEWIPIDAALKAVAWIRAGGCEVSERHAQV